MQRVKFVPGGGSGGGAGGGGQKAKTTDGAAPNRLQPEPQKPLWNSQNEEVRSRCERGAIAVVNPC